MAPPQASWSCPLHLLDYFQYVTIKKVLASGWDIYVFILLRKYPHIPILYGFLPSIHLFWNISSIWNGYLVLMNAFGACLEKVFDSCSVGLFQYVILTDFLCCATLAFLRQAPPRLCCWVLLLIFEIFRLKFSFFVFISFCYHPGGFVKRIWWFSYFLYGLEKFK